MLCACWQQILLPNGAKDVEIGVPALVLVEEKVRGLCCTAPRSLHAARPVASVISIISTDRVINE